MRKPRGGTRRPMGPAQRIKNPLALRKAPRVVERTVSNTNYITPEIIPPNVTIPRGDGKSCAIVGNAQSIMDRTDGHIIDVYDTVVRINTPKPQSKQSQGERCDILFITPLSLRRLPRQKDRSYLIVNVGTHLVDYFNMWTTALRKEVDCPKARPTTGFVAIAHMIDLGYNVSLFGFDWFKTPSLSACATRGHRNVSKQTNSTLWQYHYPEWEEATISKLIIKSAMNSQ
jgi:Glycosyltransferase family 29 (sialyltransferase)